MPGNGKELEAKMIGIPNQAAVFMEAVEAAARSERRVPYKRRRFAVPRGLVLVAAAVVVVVGALT